MSHPGDSTISRPSKAEYSKPAARKPDHGQNFVPGSERAPENLAPQPLDHFKRGYRERASLRDREMGQISNDMDSGRMGEGGPEQLPPTDSRKYHEPYARDSSFRSNGSGGGGSFDVMSLVDRLCRPGCNLMQEMDSAQEKGFQIFASGKALTAILSNLARRRKIGIALSVWQWMDHAGIEKNVFHYNSLISVCEKIKDHQRALRLLEEMETKKIKKNEVTFSSAISACEKAGQWREALRLLDQMKSEGVGRTAIAYNAAISACEKGLVPHKAIEIFEQMKREGVTPTVITYSALISAAEKGQQWKLALEVLEEMKAAGHGANVIAYSAAISALSKGQMWAKALELFREIERSGNTPSIVTYNATMTALEKGLQWERALDLFDEMKSKGLPVTVVSYGSAISACEKGLQYRQCLEFLDEMTEVEIKKNVIIFGAAMSCMEKCCRADIAFQLMERMKIEGVAPNVHIYNSAISACARCNLWEKGLELFNEMETVGVVRDVVSYNAVLDAVCSQVSLARKLFKEGVERGFYARVSRLGTQWLELDLHFLSLGGGEIALGWWFEECLVPYLNSSSKLAAVESIDIVTGYGKTRMRGARYGDDGMRKRVKAMLHFMKIKEVEQPNKGRIHVDKAALMEEVQKNDGKIVFDQEGYQKFKHEQTTASAIPDVPQQVRPRCRPLRVGEVRPRDNHDRNRSSYHGSGEGRNHDRDNNDHRRDDSRRDSHDVRRDRAGQTDHHGVNSKDSRRNSDYDRNDMDKRFRPRDDNRPREEHHHHERSHHRRNDHRHVDRDELPREESGQEPYRHPGNARNRQQDDSIHNHSQASHRGQSDDQQNHNTKRPQSHSNSYRHGSDTSRRGGSQRENSSEIYRESTNRDNFKRNSGEGDRSSYHGRHDEHNRAASGSYGRGDQRESDSAQHSGNKRTSGDNERSQSKRGYDLDSTRHSKRIAR